MTTKPVISVLGLCGQSVFLKVDHFHAPGETLHAESIHAEPGGKGYNQAVAAARLGARVNFFTCCGNDEDGRSCEDFLRREGVAPYVEHCDTASTAYAAILTDKDGENRVTVYRGAADRMSADFLRRHERVIAESDMLLLNFEYPSELNTAALELAEKYSVPAILNPAPWRETDMGFLSRFALTTPNYREALSYPGMRGDSLDELTDVLLRSPLARTVVTLGGDGALLIDQGAAYLFPPIKCSAVDTTGAGDAFTGALATALAGGKGLFDAVCFAQNAAALSVRTAFVMPSLPTPEELSAQYTELQPQRIR